jgi:uncharacterized protein YjbI with pentapeptide repeats
VTPAQLASTRNYQRGALPGLDLSGTDLSGASFAEQDLAGTRFDRTTLTDADFSGAKVNGTIFGDNRDGGFTLIQLQSTASYNRQDLSGIRFEGTDLDGWDFRDQLLFGAAFIQANLDGGDFSRADLRHAHLLPDSRDYVWRNTILIDGSIEGLDLVGGERLLVRDLPVTAPIVVEQTMTLDGSSILELVLDDATWGSAITFVTGDNATAIDLDGTLRLTFADDAGLATLVGVTFDLFDWDGQLLDGDAFARVEYPAWAAWDLSDLYDGGTVTLLAIPEPGTILLLVVTTLLARRRPY